MTQKSTLTHPECHQCDVCRDGLFGHLSPQAFEKLNTLKHFETFQKNQMIYNEESIVHGVHIIHAGRVKISQAGIYGKEQIVRLKKEGSLLGFYDLLLEQDHTYTATAINDVSICFIPDKEFRTMMEKDSKLSGKLLKQLSKELLASDLKHMNMAQKSARERIAEAIIFMSLSYGFEGDGCTIDTILSRAEIGSLAGTINKTVIRFLTEFKTDNIIDLPGKKIKILSAEKLYKVAGMMPPV